MVQTDGDDHLGELIRNAPLCPMLMASWCHCQSVSIIYCRSMAHVHIF